MKSNGIIQLAPMVRMLTFLIIGIWVGSKLAVYIPFVVWPISILSIIIIAIFARRHDYMADYIGSGLIFLLGCFTIAISELNINSTIDNKKAEYKSIVCSRITDERKIVRCDLMIVEVNNVKLDKPIKVKASIMKDSTIGNWNKLALGNGICHYSALEKPHQFDTNSNFNYPLWMKCHGYKAQTFIASDNWHFANVNHDNIPLIETAKISSQILIDNYFNKYIKPISDISYNTENGLSLLAAMTLGDKSHINRSINDRYSVAGASHILALSGLHLGIIFSLVSMLLGKRKRRNIAIQTMLIATIWIYSIIVGLPVSIIRATSMLTIYSVIGIVCRQKQSLNIFACAAFVILVVNPLSLWDVSFQLSFLAVAAILIFKDDIARLYKPHTIIGKWIWTSICISLAAQIGTAPIVAYSFGRFSCYFAFVNLVVIPLATIIIFGAAIAWILTILHPSCAIIFLPLAYIADAQDKFITWVSNLPYASIENISINYKYAVAYYLLLLVLIFIINRKKFR